MNVNRSIVINPIEPGPFSFRGGSKVDTVLNVTYFGQNSLPIHFDVDGQLQLTSRTSKVMKAYSVPAIDIANGKAQVTIPAGDLTDVNGYRAVLYGSVGGQAGMLARGTVFADDFEAPLSEPMDVIDLVPITLIRSIVEDTSFTVALWDDTGKTDPYDMASSVMTAAIYDSANRALKLVDFTVTQIADNKVTISLTHDQIAPLPDNCWWNLRIGNATGVTTLCEGPVTVSGDAVPVLVTLTTQWDYQTPNTGVPTTGQIVHQSYLRDRLLIAIVDHNGVNQATTLSALRVGDQIKSGTVTWNVIGTALVGTDYYEINIDPLDQLTATGVQDFTLQRP